MKKLIVLSFLVLLAPFTLSAQRYLSGMKGVQFTGGVVDGFNGFQTEIAYSRYNRHSNRWVTGIGLLNRKVSDRMGDIPVSQVTVNGGYFINLLSDNRKVFFLSVGLSVMTRYESINWGTRYLPDGGMIQDRNRFIYGGSASFEIETYLTDRFVLLLNVRERGMWGGDTNKFHNDMSLGLKYIIN